MPEVIRGFGGGEIVGARSRGSGVFAAYDWQDMVLGRHVGDIEAKVNEAAERDLDAFPQEEQGALTAKLGHYSRLQSIRSEDSVTWSVFQRELDSWLPGLLNDLFPRRSHPEDWQAEFWKRFPHPDTGQTHHGPEADAILTSPGWRYVVEAKWLHDIGDKQGREKKATQLDYRSHVARLADDTLDQTGVIVIAPGPRRYPLAVYQAFSTPPLATCRTWRSFS